MLGAGAREACNLHSKSGELFDTLINKLMSLGTQNDNVYVCMQTVRARDDESTR